MLKGWTSFSVSTLAVVQLRQQLEGWTVPLFKEEAAKIYTDVGAAIAGNDEAALKKLTTPSCFQTMVSALRTRPAGQRHRWMTHDVKTSIVQVRIGHHASNQERRFAQVTCSIDAQIVWTIKDKRGKLVGGVGTEAAPHNDKSHWVFERCIAEPAEPAAWRLKAKLDVAPGGAGSAAEVKGDP